jgi:hypothetical protein
MGETIISKLPASAREVIRRQAMEPPQVISPEERDAWLAGVEPQFQVEANQHLDSLADHDEKQKLEFLQGAVVTITRLLQEADLSPFHKPLLTLEEAAKTLGISLKRWNNIICDERKRLGRSPDFLCDAGGVIGRRVIRDKLLTWASRRGKNDRRRMASKL